VRFHVPKRWLQAAPRPARFVHLGRDNALDDRIRREFAEAGMLQNTLNVRPPELVVVEM